MDYRVVFDGFTIVKDNPKKIPEEFESYVVIDEYDSVLLMVWDESEVAREYDKIGAFFDGIGAHLRLKHVKAWKSVEGIKATKIE